MNLYRPFYILLITIFLIAIDRVQLPAHRNAIVLVAIKVYFRH